MKRISRNDPCWCGSGLKYKKCHMEKDQENGTYSKSIKPASGVIIKTEEQIAGIRKASKLTRDVLDETAKFVKEGITTSELNEIAHEFTIKKGGIPAPLDYHGYPKSICTSLNNVVCHGIPDNTKLKSGDIINVDVTCIVDGYFGDAGRMYLIGEVSEEKKKLVTIARECLYIGIQHVQPYRDMGEIGYAIETYATQHGYTVVRDYGGHGIGMRFHEEPHVHHYGSKRRNIPMLPGMIFTIEPMINTGGHATKLMSDGWTAVTADGSLSAQWEHTVLVTETGSEILTE